MDFTGPSFGHYRITEPLGSGGMATVYKIYDARLSRHVAVKVILSSRQQSEKSLRRWCRE